MAATKRHRAAVAFRTILIFVIVVAVFAPAIARGVISIFLNTGLQTGESRYFGIVEAGHFRPLMPQSIGSGNVRLTTIAMQTAQSPESSELDLGAQEGLALLVQGQDSGGWIYSAHVVQVYDPILTALLRMGWGRPVVELP